MFPTVPADGVSPAAGHEDAEERNRLLAVIAFEAAWERDLLTDRVSWSSGLEMFGYPNSEVSDRLSWWLERVHPQDRKRIMANADQAFRGETSGWSQEYRFLRRDGSWAWVASRARVQRDGEGRPVRAIGAMIDISEMKETEARLQLFAEQVPVRFGAVDRELQVLWDLGVGFPEMARFVGRSLEEAFEGSPDRDRVLDAYRRTLAGESSKLRVPVGERFAEVQLHPLRDGSGAVVGVAAIAMDVTERVRTEEALQEARRILLEAQRIGQVRAWEEDLRSGMVKLDLGTLPGPGAAPIGTVAREEAWKLIHPDDASRVMELRRRAIEAGGPFQAEYRLMLPDGSERFIYVRGEVVRDAAGAPERLLGTALDITDRRRAEEELRTSQRQLLDAQRLAHVGSWESDPRTGAIQMSTEARRIFFGEAPGELATFEQLLDRVHAADRERVGELRDESMQREGPLDVEYRIVRPDGSTRWILGSIQAMREGPGETTRIVGTSLDVTDRRQAEEALRKSERLLRAAEALGRTGSWEWEIGTGEILCSDENRRIFFGKDSTRGFKLEDYVELYHPEDRDRLTHELERLLTGAPRAESEMAGETEFRIITPDGSLRWILGRLEIVRSEKGKPLRALGTNTDITERKRAHEELARSAKQQAALAQLSLVVLRGGDLKPVFDEAVALVASTLGVEYGIVMEWVPENQVMEFRAGAGPWDEEIVRSITIRTAPGLMSWFYMRSEVPVVIDDLPHETRFAPCELLIKHGVRSGIAVPIAGKERRFGVLEANATNLRTFSKDEVNFVWAMANVLGTAIEQQRVAGELGDKREQLQALSRQLIEAQEAERRAIARELHDDLGQVLTAIKLNLMRREVDTAETVALVDGAIERMRDLAQDLRPPLLDELGLEASLRWYVERESRRAGLQFNVAVAPIDKRPPPAIETTCFRVAQEALTNIIRHAQAHRVDIELGVKGDSYELVVRDDGRGFDVPATRRRAMRGGSQGLLGMQERVALVRGELGIHSAPGHGTTIRAILPMAAAGGP